MSPDQIGVRAFGMYRRFDALLGHAGVSAVRLLADSENEMFVAGTHPHDPHEFVWGVNYAHRIEPDLSLTSRAFLRLSRPQGVLIELAYLPCFMEWDLVLDRLDRPLFDPFRKRKDPPIDQIVSKIAAYHRDCLKSRF